MKSIRFIITLLIAAFCFSMPAHTQSTKSKKAKTSATQKKKTTKKSTTTKKKTTTSKKKTTTSKKKSTTTKKKQTSTQKKPTTISGLKNEKAKVEKKIAQQTEKLKANERNVKQRLQNLIILNNEISDKNKTIAQMQDDIAKTDKQIKTLDKQLEQLQKELQSKKVEYVKSLQYMHRNRSDQNQLMFVFSADNFSQMYRRNRFMREYATYQRQQGEQVKSKQAEVNSKRTELANARKHQRTLLANVKKEQNALQGKQKEQQKVVSSLQSQQKTIQNIIAQQRKQSEQLDREIDRLVEIEVEKARKAAMAEAEAHRKGVEEKKKTGEKLTAEETAAEKRYSEAGMITATDYKLNGSFAANRGRLPIPLTGKYKIAERFGNYNVSGLKNIRLNNKGVNIQGQSGAKVRAVFDGVVTSVFRLPGTSQDGIIVRHGSYMTVYWPVKATRVKIGQKVKARQQLGTLEGNVLEFQLRKERTVLNPEPWLGK